MINAYGSRTVRHLPHIDCPGVPTFVTFRLAGSLPASVLDHLIAEAEAWKEQFGNTPEGRVLAHKRLIAKLDKYLDESIVAGVGPLYLSNPAAAKIVIKNLKWGVDHGRYLLHQYCIMPNHVHLVLETLPMTHKFSQYEASWDASLQRKTDADRWRDRQECLSYFKLAHVMRGIKGVSAREINILTKSTGALWQNESFDHVIRNPVEYDRIIKYIRENPVAATLCETPEMWPFTLK